MSVDSPHCPIDSFVDYALRFDPTFVTGMRSATPEEIEEFQRACGQPLPETYRCFLSRMGHEIGPLLESPWNCWMDVNNLTEYYREEVSRGESKVPAHCIIIGISGMDPESIYLRLDPPGEPTVLADYGAPSPSLEAESLANGLARMVFNSQGMAAFPIGMAFVSRDRRSGQMAVARDAALAAGFRPEWFSDSIAFCGVRDDAAISCTQIEGRELVVSLAGHVNPEMDRMRAHLVERLALERLHWKR